MARFGKTTKECRTSGNSHFSDQRDGTIKVENVNRCMRCDQKIQDLQHHDTTAVSTELIF